MRVLHAALAVLVLAAAPAANDADRLARLRAEPVQIRWSDGRWTHGTVGEVLSRGGSVETLRGTLPADDLAFLAHAFRLPGPVVVHAQARPMPAAAPVYYPPGYYQLGNTTGSYQSSPPDCPPGQP